MALHTSTEQLKVTEGTMNSKVELHRKMLEHLDPIQNRPVENANIILQNILLLNVLRITLY